MLQYPTNFRMALAMLMAVVLLSACGGGGGGSASTASSGAPSPVFRSAATAPTIACPTGGIVVNSGIDTNLNAVLDSNEITSTQNVCNGSNGASTLLNTVAEPVGVHCANSGMKILVGVDINNNQTLDSNEVQSTAYVCNGATGTAGAIGATGAQGTQIGRAHV